MTVGTTIHLRRAATMILVWFAGCTAINHHEYNNIGLHWHQTWLESAFLTGKLALFSLGTMAVVWVCVCWIYGIRPFDPKRRKS
jgi:hypothetical protein